MSISAYRVILAHLSAKIAGINTQRLKALPSYVSVRKSLLSHWDREGMDTLVKSQKVRDTIISVLSHLSLSESGEDVKSDIESIFHDVHEMAVSDQLTIFDKFNDNLTYAEFKKSLKDLEDIRKKKIDGGLSDSEREVFNRVKVIKDFGNFKWVLALDSEGKPCGFMPQSVTNKTMGHCGNEPSVKPGDNYYELRGSNNKPQVTVIIDKNSKIKESKGANNQVPSNKKELLPYMKWLMIDSGLVKGVSYDEGYARDRNFGIIQYLDDDPEFVSKVEKEHPELLHEGVDKPILDYRRKLKSGDITEGKVIEAWETKKEGLSLDILRGIFGRMPFNEDDFIKYIKSGRLDVPEIARAGTSYLTKRVQEEILSKKPLSCKHLLNIHVQVPTAKILVNECVKAVLGQVESKGFGDATEGLVAKAKEIVEEDPSLFGLIQQRIMRDGYTHGTLGLSRGFRDKLSEDPKTLDLVIANISDKGVPSNLQDTMVAELEKKPSYIKAIKKAIINIGWDNGVFGLSNKSIIDTLRNDPDVISAIKERVIQKGFRDSLKTYPDRQDFLEYLLKDPEVRGAILKRIATKGLEDLGRVSESTLERALEAEDFKSAVIEGLAKNGDMNGLTSLSSDQKKKILEDPILEKEILKRVSSFGWSSIRNIFSKEILADLRDSPKFIPAFKESIRNVGLKDSLSGIPNYGELLDNFDKYGLEDDVVEGIKNVGWDMSVRDIPSRFIDPIKRNHPELIGSGGREIEI